MWGQIQKVKEAEQLLDSMGIKLFLSKFFFVFLWSHLFLMYALCFLLIGPSILSKVWILSLFFGVNAMHFPFFLLDQWYKIEDFVSLARLHLSHSHRIGVNVKKRSIKLWTIMCAKACASCIVAL